MKSKLIIIILSAFILTVTSLMFVVLGVRNAYLFGLAGALTPCTIVLIPIFLYRFGVWGDAKILLKEIFITLVGFLISFSIIGLAFETLSQSFLFDAVKILLAIGMMSLAVLQFTHKLNFDFLSKVSNPFILGLLLPLSLSFSSCVLPFFSVNLVTAAESGAGLVVLNTIAFGVGLILPALLVGIFGGTLYSFIKKSGNVTRFIDYVAGFIVLGSGIYITTRIENLYPITLFIVFTTLLIFISFIAYKIFKDKALRTKLNFSLLITIVISFILVLSRVLYLAGNYVTSSKHLYSCTYQQIICKECTEASILLGIFAAISTYIYLIITNQIKLPKLKITSE